MEASAEEKQAVVTHDPARVTHEQIIATIEKLGYECELESSTLEPAG